MKGRFLLAAALLSAAAVAGARGDDGPFEKTIPFPRSTDEILDTSGNLIRDGEHSGSVDAGRIDESIRVAK